MKALVTGAAGFLGRHIVDELQKKGFEIATVVRPTSDVKYLREKKVELIEGDLRDSDCIAAAAKNADVMVHAAATLRGKWEDFYEVNVETTRMLLEQAVTAKVKRFVFISSIIVYDHSSALGGETFTEKMPYEEAEQSYYCKTKIEGERLPPAASPPPPLLLPLLLLRLQHLGRPFHNSPFFRTFASFRWAWELCVTTPSHQL